MYRLLFIGNGFDIAHKKCTKYKDFLYACASLINKTDFKYSISDEYKDSLDKVANIFVDKYKNDTDIINIIEKNNWINYFFNPHNEDWVDFENEIKNICEVKINYDNIPSSSNEIKELAESYSELYLYVFDDDRLEFRDVDLLSEHLNQLIDVLNKYLLIVDSIQNDCYSRDVLQFSPTNVISFNYTNTFKNIYFNEMNDGFIDFIHGHINNQNNNLVLGFNKLNDDKYTVEYFDFLKLYQRINKDVEINVYNKALDYWKKFNGDPGIDSMFFGHSLDITDENIIKNAIKISQKVVILYYSKKHKASMIKNLLKMYTMEEFEELCLSYKHKIVFRKQQDMIYENKRELLNNYFNALCSNNEKFIDYLKSKQFEKLNMSKKNYVIFKNRLTYIKDTTNYKCIELEKYLDDKCRIY